MKTKFKSATLSFLFLLCFLNSEAVNYYLSLSGNDSNTGTSPSNAWLTITRLNVASFLPGDSIFFNSGDVFRGTVNLHQSGSATQPIVFCSYGTGSKAVISGAMQVSGFTLSSGIYQVAFAQQAKNFFVNDKEMTLARYPNNGSYLTLDSANGTSLHDNALNASFVTSWPGTKVCIHTAQWCWEKAGVNTYAPGLLNFTPVSVTPSLPNYGYFLYNNIAFLDTAGEWFFDSLGSQLSLKAPVGLDPNLQNCEASVSTFGIRIFPAVSHVVIENLAFDKQSLSGVAMMDSTIQFVNISNCDFSRQYFHGIQLYGKYHSVKNCTFREVDGHGVDVNKGGNSEIDHNTFRKIGMFRNGGIGGQANLSAIAVNFTDSCHIHHNDIDSSGYCGISADGAYHLVERNVIKHCMLLNNDGAPLKAYGAPSHHSIFRNNFLSDTPGSTEGTANAGFKTPGFYFDFNVSYCTVLENTIYNVPHEGIFQNGGSNHNSLTSNVVYGSDVCVWMNGNIMPNPINSDVFKHNTFVASSATSIIISQAAQSAVFDFGIFDSNYYFNPYSTTVAQRSSTGPATTYTLSNWQTTSGNDLHTKGSFVSWTLPQNDTELFKNISDTVAEISLGSDAYFDLDSNQVCGSITLQPYTSKVLINTHSACTLGITEIKNQTEFAVYPVPFSESFFIEFPDASSSRQIQVFDVSGKERIHTSTNETKMLINGDNWSSGMYIIKVGGSVKKLLKN